jgi:uncharacterized protein involved in outer membrane biogenesis
VPELDDAMKKKSFVLLLSAAILIPVLLLVISLIILSNIDLNKHRDTIAEHVSEATGRQLSLNGELELNLASITSIVITDVALANATWASEPDMLTIQRFEIKVELYPLLSGDLYIPHFHLDGVKVLVETDASGLSNWVLTEQAQDQVRRDEPAPPGEIKFPWIGNMKISDVVLNYHDGQTGKKISTKLDHAKIITADKTSLTEIDIAGRVNQHPVEINGKLGLPLSLSNSSTELPVDINANLLDFKVNVVGAMTGTINTPNADLKIQANAANLKKIRQVFGSAVPTIGKINLNTRLNAEKSKLTLSEMELQLGGGKIDGLLQLDSSSSIPEIAAELSLTKLDFDKLLTAKGGKEEKSKGKKETKPRTDRVFSNDPLPLDQLSLANINVTLHFKDVIRNNKRLKEALIKIKLDEGKFTATILKHSLVQGEFVAELMIDGSDKEMAAMSTRLNVPKIELSEIIIADTDAAAVKGPLAIDIDLHSQGNTVAQLMGSLDGNIKLLMEQGSADAKALDMLVGGLTAMVGTIFTADASKTTINCAISDLKVDHGMVKPQLAVLDTQYSTVFATGLVDLKNEQLNIEITPVAKGVTLSVATPVHLQGAFAKPQVNVDKTGALLKTGEVWATIAYPPALLLKFSDVGDGENNPCVSMVAKKAGVPFVEDVGKAVKGTVEGTGKMLKGVGGALKGAGSDIGNVLKQSDDASSQQTDTTDAVEEDDFNSD